MAAVQSIIIGRRLPAGPYNTRAGTSDLALSLEMKGVLVADLLVRPQDADEGAESGGKMRPALVPLLIFQLLFPFVLAPSYTDDARATM